MMYEVEVSEQADSDLRGIPAALATTVGVLTEVPVMLTLVKIANRLKGAFHE